MLVLATFFPDSESDLGSDIIGVKWNGSSLLFADICGTLQEFLKATVDLADILGLYIVLSSIPGKGHCKVLTAGIGWATAEVILSRALLLWVGARGAEFDWKYIQKCLESNISLVQHIATVTLIWLWTRNDLKANLKPVVTALLFASSYKGLLLDILFRIFLTSPWLALLSKAFVTLAIGGFTLTIYAGLAQSIGIF